MKAKSFLFVFLITIPAKYAFAEYVPAFRDVKIGTKFNAQAGEDLVTHSDIAERPTKGWILSAYSEGKGQKGFKDIGSPSCYFNHQPKNLPKKAEQSYLPAGTKFTVKVARLNMGIYDERGAKKGPSAEFELQFEKPFIAEGQSPLTSIFISCQWYRPNRLPADIPLDLGLGQAFGKFLRFERP